MPNFESLIQNLFKEEMESFLLTKREQRVSKRKRYMTMKELAGETGIDSYVLRRLTYERAMPHRKVGNRLIFDLIEVLSIAERKSRMCEVLSHHLRKMWPVDA